MIYLPKADSAFWRKANKHLPVTSPVTKLVNPNLNKVKYQAQLDSAEGGVPADDGTRVHRRTTRYVGIPDKMKNRM